VDACAHHGAEAAPLPTSVGKAASRGARPRHGESERDHDDPIAGGAQVAAMA